MALSNAFTHWESGDGPDAIGVYELAWPAPTDTGYAVVYIGSGDIRRRLRAHARDPDKHWVAYRCRVTNCRRRARQIERREQRRFLDRHGRLPKYNHQIG